MNKLGLEKTGTVQQILTLRLLVEKARRKGRKIYSCFIDFQKAFDNINQQVAWEVLKSYGVNHKLIKSVKMQMKMQRQQYEYRMNWEAGSE